VKKKWGGNLASKIRIQIDVRISRQGTDASMHKNVDIPNYSLHLGAPEEVQRKNYQEREVQDKPERNQ